MAESESDSRLDEMERDNLQKAISEVEVALAASTPGTRSPLANFVENAKSRVAMLEKKIKESKTERESRAEEQATMVSIAQKEAALSAPEKEAFSGFLGKEFFTKNDFASLDKFYANTWDRLSQTGKDEMSHRIWEGVRRDEYKFSELPNSVREREAKQAYRLLRDSSISADNALRVPEGDRADFIRAYEGGNRDEAAKVLDRDSFKKAMFLKESSKSVGHARAEVGRERDGQQVGATIAAGNAPGDVPAKSSTGGKKSDLDLSSVDLNGIKLVETTKDPSAANMPKDSGPTRGGASLRGG